MFEKGNYIYKAITLRMIQEGEGPLSEMEKKVSMKERRDEDA